MRILYVDDEPDIREVACLSLELDPDFEVRSCGSGAEALALLEGGTWLPDLILLDVMMPGMDGPTTFGELRARPALAAIPVVFITARTQSYEVERFLKLGALGAIAKPFDPMELPAEARRLAGK